MNQQNSNFMKSIKIRYQLGRRDTAKIIRSVIENTIENGIKRTKIRNVNIMIEHSHYCTISYTLHGWDVRHILPSNLQS